MRRSRTRPLAPVPPDPYRYRSDQQPPRPVHQLLEPARPAIDCSKTSFRLPHQRPSISRRQLQRPPPSQRRYRRYRLRRPIHPNYDSHSENERATMAEAPPTSGNPPSTTTTTTTTTNTTTAPGEPTPWTDETRSKFNSYAPLPPCPLAPYSPGKRSPKELGQKADRRHATHEQQIPKRIPRPLPRGRAQEHPVSAQERGR